MRHDIKGPKWDLETGIPDLTGKVAIVTGAHSPNSIGWNVALQLAKRGAKVYLGAISAEDAATGIYELRKASPDIALDVKALVMDLTNLRQVKAVTESLAKEESRLDILVNNAATLARRLGKTEYGVSVSFATNHLGPYLFTLGLLLLLQRTAAEFPGVRVVASTSHSLVPEGITFNSVDDFNIELGGQDDFKSNMMRYGLSKLANILFIKELQNRFDKEGIDIVALCVHPGGVLTDGIITLVGGSMEIIKQKEGMTPLEGAMTPLFAAANPIVWEEREKYKGQYLMPYGVISETSENAGNPELATQLWETSERVVNSVLGDSQG